MILASRSPRRKHLLKELGFTFDVIPYSDVDEDYPPELKPDQIPVYLARKKASGFSEDLDQNTILITADTIVWYDNRVLDKPKDEADAYRILKKLSGNMHTVITGVCLKSAEKEVAFSETTNVYFASLNDKEIDYYLKKFQPYDKAGAYGIQEWIGYIGIEKIEGSYFNVMGLPVQKLYVELKRF